VPLPDDVVAAFVRGAKLAQLPDGAADALARAIADGGAARPSVAASAVEFAESVGDSVADADDIATAIAALHAGDLWLATACASADAVAIVELDAVLSSLRPTLAHMGANAEAVDELLQQMRTRLLVAAPERPPRIRGYRGRGDLRSWLKVALVRDAVRALRSNARAAREEDDDEIERLMDPEGDPEMRGLQDSYRTAFRAAFERALAMLPVRDRNVLRYHLVEGLSIDDIGAIYRVHRATSARWLVRIRERLYDATRAELMRDLAVTPAELDSVLRLIRSRLDASVARGLEAPGT
jgi:RNA polymerase sigma-70 factor (ECF subfamily)